MPWTACREVSRTDSPIGPATLPTWLHQGTSPGSERVSTVSDNSAANSTTDDKGPVSNSPATNTPPIQQAAPPAAQPPTQDLSQLLTAIAAMPESIARSVAEAVKPPKSAQPAATETKATETKATETAKPPVDNKTGPGDVGNSSMSFGDKFRKWWSEG